MIKISLFQTPESVIQTDSTDNELVRRAQASEVSAFETLYRRHVGRVHGAIWRLCGRDHARADELTQDAFVRAWQKLHSFRFESSFGTWLYRLAVNIALMDIRSRSTHGDFIEDDADFLENLPARAPHLCAGEQQDLERAISYLPPRARAVLVLHDVEGWRHEEIAQELGMAVGSSKAQLHRARNLVRQALGESHERI